MHAAQVGTPVCVPSQNGIELGRIASLELNHKVRAQPPGLIGFDSVSTCV